MGSVWVLLFHLGLLLKGRGRSRRRTAAFPLTEHCRDNKVPGSCHSGAKGGARIPPLLIIYCSNWL